jgi:hypothetical protein
MMSGVETRLEGTTLVVRIPMRFQRRGGRKRIVAPDGSEIVPTSMPQPDGTLVKALARAWRWQRMLDDGVYATVSDIGDAENISKSYVSRILRLPIMRWCWGGWSGCCRRVGRSSGGCSGMQPNVCACAGPLHAHVRSRHRQACRSEINAFP